MSDKNKQNADLKRQIKEMEDKKRLEAMASLKVELIESHTKEEKLSFDQWWMLVQHKIKLKPHLREIVLADFKARGLSMSETEQKYDDSLRIFGYKL